MDYTNNDKEIVFLNDRNIVHELSGGKLPDYNAIPSLSLLQSCFVDLCAHSDALCAAVSAQVDRNRINDKKELSNSLSTHSNNLCSQLCTEIDKSFLKKTGGVIDGSLSITSSLVVGKDASASDQNSIAFGHNAHATHHNSFVWNGSNIEDTDGKSDYSSNDSHTFNLNPANGLCGVYVGENTLCSLISEDIKLSANAITSYVEKTYAQVSDVYKLAEIDHISAELCSAVSSQFYVKKNDVHFAYDINNHVLNLSVADDKILSVSTNQFEVGRFIHKVYLTADGGTTYLAIQFKIVGDSDNLSKPVDDSSSKKDPESESKDPESESSDDATTDSIDTYDAGTTIVDDALGSTLQEIRIDISKLVQLYIAGQGISITSDEHGYKVSITDDIYNNIEKIDEIEEYVDKLSGDGTPANPGIIAAITTDVDVLKIQDTRELKFDKIITLNESNLTSSEKLYLSALIGSESAHEDDVIRNGSIFLVQYSDGADKSKKYETVDGAILGDNDFIVIRTLGKDEATLKLSDLKVKNSSGSIDKNVYITNAVHRYEYENLSSDLSNAIVSANTKIDKKIYIDGVSAETLCAEHIDADTFHQKVVDGKLLSNVMYVVSSDYINAYDQRIENVKDPVEKQDAATKNYVDTVSVDLHNYTNSVSTDLSTALYKQLTAEEDARINVDTVLSSQISSKVYIGDYISASDKYEMSSTNLSIVKIHADDYHKKVANHTISNDIVYIVSSDYLNAYDNFVKNVKTPEDETDAANKKYVDDISTTISSELNDKIKNKIIVDGTKLDTLSVTHIKNEDFYKLVADGNLEESVMYIVSGDYVNAYDRQIKFVLDPKDDQDAATKHYVDTNTTSTVEIIKTVSSDIDTAVKNKVWVGGFYQTTSDTSATYHQDTTIENLSVVNIGAEDYYKLVANDAENTSVVYIVSSDTINAYDQRIENVATPTYDTDAANKKYVDEHGAVSLKSAILNDPVLKKYATDGININDAELSTMLCAAISLFNTAIRS